MLLLFYLNQIKKINNPKYKMLKLIHNKKKQFKMKIQKKSQIQNQNNKMHHLFYKIQMRKNKIHKKILLSHLIKKMNSYQVNLLNQQYRIRKPNHKKKKQIEPHQNKNKSQKKKPLYRIQIKKRIKKMNQRIKMHLLSFQIQIKKKIKKKNLKNPHNPKSKLKKQILSKKSQFKQKSQRIKMRHLFYQIQIKKRIHPLLIQSNNLKQF